MNAGSDTVATLRSSTKQLERNVAEHRRRGGDSRGQCCDYELVRAHDVLSLRGLSYAQRQTPDAMSILWARFASSLMPEGFGMFGNFLHRSAAPAARDNQHAGENQQRRDEGVSAHFFS